ncbi:MAG: peptidase S9, partial [Acidobacteria bacterium]
ERMLTGGTPWEYRSRFIENSPIFYLDHVATPLLIFHGGDDSAVPPYCADEVFVSLRRLGKTVEYAKYSGEDHYPQYWSIANRTDYINRMLAWFDKYLKVQPPAKGN